MDSSIITSTPDIMHGTPCFAGTRVPVKSFFDHLQAGYTLDGFLEQFPSVSKQQILNLLNELEQAAEREAQPASR
ncbi:MAG TPA: DUF433 domain-containing protein [Tepidisphaeraceae bacterium]|nr:DUF433 domain-containing protein [Tepidisphaeraceae bacterium]